jgi:hypothetical protein
MIKYWIVQNSHGTKWGNNDFLRFNKDIRGLDDSHINGGIDSTKIIYPEPQAGKKDKKRRSTHKARRSVSNPLKILICFFLLCEWTFSFCLLTSLRFRVYNFCRDYSPIYEGAI